VDSQSAWTSAIAAWNSSGALTPLSTLRVNLGLLDG